MDKHWKDVKVGDIIEVDCKFAKVQYNTYYKLCEGEFTANFSKYYGKYFKCLGTNDIRFLGRGTVGYNLLNSPYKIIDKLPENLYK